MYSHDEEDHQVNNLLSRPPSYTQVEAQTNSTPYTTSYTNVNHISTRRLEALITRLERLISRFTSDVSIMRRQQEDGEIFYYSCCSFSVIIFLMCILLYFGVYYSYPLVYQIPANNTTNTTLDIVKNMANIIKNVTLIDTPLH